MKTFLRNLFALILVGSVVAALVGCDRTQEKCQDEIEEVKYLYGEPDEIIRIHTANVQTIRFIYERERFEYIFSFGHLVDGCNVDVERIEFTDTP